MSDLLNDLKKHYQLLLQEKAMIEKNLLKLEELIQLNEKNTSQNEKNVLSTEKTNGEDVNRSSQFSLPNREDNKKTAQSILLNREEPVKPSHTITPGSQYDPNMNWQQKITIAMRLIAKPATAREIAERIKQLEPRSELSVDKSVELTTSRMYKSGEIDARKEGVRNFYVLKS